MIAVHKNLDTAFDLFSYLKNIKCAEKCIEHKTCDSFSSTTYVGNNFCSDKYLVSYA
jgi:hypothetical protein